MTVYSRITGTGSYLPPRRLSNADLVAQLAADGVESSDEWIVERTGIRARYFVADGVYSSDLAFEVALSRAYDAAHHQLLARVERRLAHAAPLLAAAMAAETIA